MKCFLKKKKIFPMDIYKISVTFLFVRMTIQAVMKEYDT